VPGSARAERTGHRAPAVWGSHRGVGRPAIGDCCCRKRQQRRAEHAAPDESGSQKQKKSKSNLRANIKINILIIKQNKWIIIKKHELHACQNELLIKLSQI
jgi:hypothetical protein